MANKIAHHEGIDWMRAVMSVIVVVWHMGFAGHSGVFSKETYRCHVWTVLDGVYFHVLLLAVPLFTLVSNYLYVRAGPSLAALGRRLRRIGILLSFWPLAWILCKQGYPGLARLVPDSWSCLLKIVLTAGDTIYYYFVSLILTLLLTHVIAGWRTSRIVLGFAVSIGVVCCLPLVSMHWGLYPLSAYWNPLNFLPYSWAAVWIARHGEQTDFKRAVTCGLLTGLGIPFAVFEWKCSIGDVFFPGQGCAIPIHTRASLVLVASAAFILVLTPTLRSGRIVRFMARYALALYCLHPFLTMPARRLVSLCLENGLLATSCATVLVIGGSYALSVVLGLYLREEVLR